MRGASPQLRASTPKIPTGSLRISKRTGASNPAGNNVESVSEVRKMDQVTRSPRKALWSATLGFFVGFAAVALFGPSASRFQQVMGLGPLALGFLVAVPSLTGSLLRIPFSAWVDTSGGRKPFLWLLNLAVIGMIGLALVARFLYPAHLTYKSYPLLMILGALS